MMGATQIEKKLDRLTQMLEGVCRLSAAVRKANQRMGAKTQEEFDKLPGLLSRETFLDWTGLPRDYVDQEVAAERIKVLVLREGGHRKYYKSEVARLANFRM